MISYKGGPIKHVIHVTTQVSQSGVDSEYNAARTAVIALENFMMIIHELLNKDTDTVPEEVINS